MSKFFIKWPIVAMVIAILTVIVGAVTIATLPIAQFPNIAPPEIRLQANYPGADAKTLEDAVATPIEQQVNGVDSMSYMYSLNATANQQTTLIVDFDLKTDPNSDLLLTQSREQLATGQLPPEVNSYGVTLKKSTTAPLMLIALHSPHGTHDAAYLANYAYINLNDPIARLYGVGQTQVFGSGQYAMRLWVKPDQLAKLGITITDIANAIQAQNTVNPAGQVGGEPAPRDQQFTYTVLAQGRLTSPEQFGNIVVREAPNGGTVRVKDVARVELGTQDYSLISRLNGNPSAAIAVYQLPGSNAVQTVAGVRKLLAQMKQRFPEDIDYAISLDQTASVTEGMKEILETLLIAIVLVILVVYLFLQDWRATLIPLLAVPVSLVGTFVIFPLFGFSINTLSMFGLVLAIGLVVDDAIVVVEGVQRHIEEGLAPKDAARKAMDELSGPVIGIALVLSSVFVPTAFIPGITGRLYQQFAVTIAISVVLSAFNALTLSPALAGLLLRRKQESHGLLRRFFERFNRVFERATGGYVRWSGALIRKGAVVLVLLLACGVAGIFFGSRVPSSFLPDEDQGYLYINMQLPNAASLERTSAAAAQVEKILANTPSVEYTTSVVGFSLLSYVRTSYNAFFWVTLKPWDERKSRTEQFQAIKARLNQELRQLPAGTAFSFSPPAIPGVGTAGGFQFVLEDRAGRDVQFLANNLAKFLAAARKRPEIGTISTTFLPSVPQDFIYVDRDKALGIETPNGWQWSETLPPQLPAGLPSTLLERRPDIREAEQNLVAANANIGVAKAMFFPQISLLGSGGGAWGHSTFLGASIPAPLGIGSYAASAMQPIFEGGYLRNNLRYAKSQDRQTLISYQQTIQRAFGDVSDALIGYDKYHHVRERQEQTVKDLQASVDVSLMRYKGGTANYLEVLDSQRSLFEAEFTLAQNRNNEYQSLVQLYKALGGGWK